MRFHNSLVIIINFVEWFLEIMKTEAKGVKKKKKNGKIQTRMIPVNYEKASRNFYTIYNLHWWISCAL